MGVLSRTVSALAAATSGLLVAGPCLAWGPEGHELVGQIADELLNAHAKAQVKQYLGYDLKTAAPFRSRESAECLFHQCFEWNAVVDEIEQIVDLECIQPL